jgi:hypothetical protein
MVTQSLLDHLHRLVVVLRPLLQDDHVLFESSDESAIILPFLNDVVNRRALWLESLSHYSNTFLLNELSQFLEMLGDPRFGIIPDPNCVIFEA